MSPGTARETVAACQHHYVRTGPGGHTAIITAAVITVLAAAAGCSGGDAQGDGGQATATWQLAPGQGLQDDATTFTALVTRLGCNNGVTGQVNDPLVEESDDTVTITFTVSPGASREAVTCQGNEEVSYDVQLPAPLAGRILVDGACASTEAGQTVMCEPDGTRSAA
ncbi:hypothetical protein [Kineococcus terrestris]|uniref:hypothetical protein n=1 Tax=Kineococcus terrestris TaxID=2044856 RepID=UPI0034DB35A7